MHINRSGVAQLAEHSAVNRRVVGSSPTPRAQGADCARARAPVTIEDLTRWEDNGATWRAVEISDERAVVELCTCYGEPVDIVQSEAPELIEFARAHRAL